MPEVDGSQEDPGIVAREDFLYGRGGRLESMRLSIQFRARFKIKVLISSSPTSQYTFLRGTNDIAM